MADEFGIVEHRTPINTHPKALSECPAKALGVAVGTPSRYLSRSILDRFNQAVDLDPEFWRPDDAELTDPKIDLGRLRQGVGMVLRHLNPFQHKTAL